MQPFHSILILAVLIIGSTINSSEAAWKLFDGTVVEGELVEFDYSSKNVTLELGNGSQSIHNSADFAFQSKRELLFTAAFQQSYPSGNFGMWPVEKFWYFGLAAVAPVLLLILGMWLAGLFIARKFSPFKAIRAFLGSWLAGVLLFAVYLWFASKNEGSATWLFLLGGLLATVAMAFFVASVYNTKFLKGLFVFIAHIAFAGLVGYFLIYNAELFVPIDQVSAFWDEFVFSRVGLLDGPSRQGY